MAEPRTCPPEHLHGRTLHCYKTHSCRCESCRAKASRAERERKKAIADGRYLGGLKSAARSIVHIELLNRGGMSYRQIAARAGVNPKTLHRLMTGKAVVGSTERAILAVRLHVERPPLAQVDSTGTRRRLEALMTLGYTATELSIRLGKSADWVSSVLRRFMVHEQSRLDVRELFEVLSMTPAPATREAKFARTWARNRGYAPPLAWDDIDDPDEEPKIDGAPTDDIESALRGDRPDLTPAGRREVITVLNERRWSGRQIAAHIGCNVKTVERIRAELGLPIYLSSTPKNGRIAA
jgi:DNA-directed RNA polymerase specialized sigma24 family protein